MLLRRLLREVRHAPDRLLHRRRGQLLRHRLGSLPNSRSVLFVCQGNIYRSPFAAAVFVRTLPDSLRQRIQVSSCGFVGPNRPSPADAVTVAAGRGVDLSLHRSSLITPERIRSADLIVVMDATQRRRVLKLGGVEVERVVVLGDLDPEGICTRAIVDPWKEDDRLLRESYERVERCTREMATTLSRAADLLPEPR